jgi:hypothetical protein
MEPVVVPPQPAGFDGETSPVGVNAARADVSGPTTEDATSSAKQNDIERLAQRRNTVAPPLKDRPMMQWTAEDKPLALNNGLLSLRPSASSLPNNDNS